MLGWQTWRAIEAEHGLGLITDLIERAAVEPALLTMLAGLPRGQDSS